MQTIKLKEKVGADGILRLEIPLAMPGEEMEISITQSPSHQLSTEAWIEATYGSIQDPTFMEPEELPHQPLPVIE